MIEFLIRRFVPDWQQVQRTDVREHNQALVEKYRRRMRNL